MVFIMSSCGRYLVSSTAAQVFYTYTRFVEVARGTESSRMLEHQIYPRRILDDNHHVEHQVKIIKEFGAALFLSE